MREPPVDLRERALRDCLREHWSLDPVSFRYLPVGFGSHHWVAEDRSGRRWFVTVDNHRLGRLGLSSDESIDGLDRAMRTASALRNDMDLDFVISPVHDDRDELVRRIPDTSFSASLFPYMEASAIGEGVYQSEADRQEALRMIGQVHRATGSLPEKMTRTDDLSIPRRTELVDALANLDVSWDSGPYAAPTRQLLQPDRANITQALAHYDELAAGLHADPTGWVITHGEPHPANIVRDTTGKLFLVDWDTVLVAPRERDLWMMLPDPDHDLTAYAEWTGVKAVSSRAMKLFRMRWDLAEIAEYISWFRGPHQDSEDNAVGWENLAQYVPVKAAYLGG